MGEPEIPEWVKLVRHLISEQFEYGIHVYKINACCGLAAVLHLRGHSLIKSNSLNLCSPEIHADYTECITDKPSLYV